MYDLVNQLPMIIAVAIPAILAITLHEAAHGFVARWRGDDTAYMLGRVTLNPIKHIDPFGTVLLPAVMYFSTGFVFGWAKPVPVNVRRLNNPRSDMVWVALAGPGINFALAFVSALLLHAFQPTSGLEFWVAQSLQISVLVNVILMVFNLIPLPPLDGGRVAVGVLPDRLAFPLARLENVGIFIILGLFFLLPMLLREFGIDFNPSALVLWPAIDAMINFIAVISGLK